MKNYQTHTLPNGLRIIHKPTDSAVSYCGFIVNAGTRDEHCSEYGMAHFVEHMLFKGTTKRKAHNIINRMENVGGELNAYTNKEETVLYSIFMEEHIGRAFELLSDLMFNSTFPSNEIKKETDVIIDEIHSYEDSPSELIYDEFENLVFKDSDLGHNILGTEESLLNFDTEKAKAFTNCYYIAPNIVFFSLGKTNMKRIIYLAEKYLSNLPVTTCNHNRKVASIIQSTHNTESKDTSQAHVLIGSRSYNLFDPKRRTLRLLCNILGGPGMNSKLNIALREKRGYVYTVESSLTSYTDSGLFSIYFGCDKENTNKCIDLTYAELNKFRNNKLSSSQLMAAKKQITGQISVASDNRENVSLSMAKSYLHFNHCNTLEETFAQIEAITSDDIIEVANEILDPNRMFHLIYN